jgi:hypothetical protein
MRSRRGLEPVDLQTEDPAEQFEARAVVPDR